MGRPDQGNNTQTPVGYSRDTGVSTGGPAKAVTGVVARELLWPRFHGSLGGRAAALSAQRSMSYDAPSSWASCKAYGEQPYGPGNGEVRIEECDGVMVRLTVW